MTAGFEMSIVTDVIIVALISIFISFVYFMAAIAVSTRIEKKSVPAKKALGAFCTLWIIVAVVYLMLGIIRIFGYFGWEDVLKPLFHSFQTVSVWFIPFLYFFGVFIVTGSSFVSRWAFAIGVLIASVGTGLVNSIGVITVFNQWGISLQFERNFFGYYMLAFSVIPACVFVASLIWYVLPRISEKDSRKRLMGIIIGISFLTVGVSMDVLVVSTFSVIVARSIVLTGGFAVYTAYFLTYD